MADLTTAHRAALAHLADSVSDEVLKTLAAAVAAMPGGKAREMAELLAGAETDRKRRARGFAALAPMFSPAPDGMEATRFPAAVLPRLWKIAATNEADVVPALDSRDDHDDAAQRIATVCSRLLTSAAAAVRDRPEVIWPVGDTDPNRLASLAAMASAFDLGNLIQRTVPSLKSWAGRPNADQTAEFRLLVRDAAAIAPDGARLFLEIVSAHLNDGPKSLRLVLNSSEPACRESFLAESELAGLVDRMIKAGEFRAARVKAWKTTDDIERLNADLAWITDLLIEAEITLRPRPDGPWGKRLNRIRADIGAEIGGLLGRVAKPIDLALPMSRVQISGRLSREVPRLTMPIDPDVLGAATTALDVLRRLRNFTGPFGCEAQRVALVETLTLRFATYADLALEEINQGTAGSDAVAIARVETAADFLERIEAEVDARSVRRRVAVAAIARRDRGPSPNAD